MALPNGGAKGEANQGGSGILPPGREFCPFAAECRRRWTHLTGTETAECGYCYQVLDRSTMARIIAGAL